MGQNLKDRSEVCPLPPGPLKDLNLYPRPNPILVAVSLTFILATAGLVYYWMLPRPLLIMDEDPIERTPLGVITIDGDVNFATTALLEGWPGDGTPEDPFIIDGLDIDLGGEPGHCISISNTRVSFTISNCNLTSTIGGMLIGHGFGISLYDVSNGELVNNTCTNNTYSIWLIDSSYNTVANNSCNSNGIGIFIINSNSTTVVNNTCTNNWISISIEWSNSTTVANNTCNNSRDGIGLSESSYSTVANNFCSNNSHGISIWNSNSTTVANNTCNNNGDEHSWYGSGIHLGGSDYNTVANNFCSNNTYFGICLDDSSYNTITDNTLNGCGFSIDCRQLELTGNSVNTLPLVFLQDQVGNVVSYPAGQVILVGCSQVTVKEQTLMDCSVGILLCHTNLTTLVNNTCTNNWKGICLDDSSYNTVANNNCSSNDIGISLSSSISNTVNNNTCTGNGGRGIYLGGNHNSEPIIPEVAVIGGPVAGIFLDFSDSNTVANNTCNSNDIGISLSSSISNTVNNNTCFGNTYYGIGLLSSDSNTVANNTCNSNDIGISLDDGIHISWDKSDSNTVVNNTCNNNRIGIYLYALESNTVANNSCLGNTEIDIADESIFEQLAHREFVAREFVWFLAGFGMILVVSVVAFVQFRRMEIL